MCPSSVTMSVLRVSHGAERELGHRLDGFGESVVADSLPVVACRGGRRRSSSEPAWTPRSAAIVKRAAASISTARTPRPAPAASLFGVGIVERVARCDRPDSEAASRAPSPRGRRRAAAPSLPSARGARRPRNAASSRRREPRTGRGRDRRGRAPAAGRRRFRRGGDGGHRARRAPRRRSLWTVFPCRLPGQTRACRRTSP